MDSIVVIRKITTGSEADRLLNEVARWADPAADVAAGRRDENTLEVVFTGMEYERGREMVDQVLAAASPTWSIHVAILNP